MSYIYPQSWSTEFFNKIIASDMIILWIIQRQSMFSIVIIAISLIITLNIVKSWQPLHEESWNLDPWLKNQ